MHRERFSIPRKKEKVIEVYPEVRHFSRSRVVVRKVSAHIFMEPPQGQSQLIVSTIQISHALLCTPLDTYIHTDVAREEAPGGG